MESLQGSVPGFLAELLRKAPLSPEKLSFAWQASVGPAIARVSTVQLSDTGVVEVSCAEDHWRREIRRSAPLIKERLVKLLGDEVIKQIKVPGATHTGIRRRRPVPPDTRDRTNRD